MASWKRARLCGCIAVMLGLLVLGGWELMRPGIRVPDHAKVISGGLVLLDTTRSYDPFSELRRKYYNNRPPLQQLMEPGPGPAAPAPEFSSRRLAIQLSDALPRRTD